MLLSRNKIARDHTYPDRTLTMVDNGARVFMLAEIEEVLNAQQGKALLCKSLEKDYAERKSDLQCS